MPKLVKWLFLKNDFLDLLPLSKFKSMVPIFIKYHQQFGIEKPFTYYLSPRQFQKTKPY